MPCWEFRVYPTEAAIRPCHRIRVKADSLDAAKNLADDDSKDFPGHDSPRIELDREASSEDEARMGLKNVILIEYVPSISTEEA